MKESVVIKGTKSGIILVLDDKLPYEQLKEAGVPAGLIRISCGLEDKKDLIADISSALDTI